MKLQSSAQSYSENENFFNTVEKLPKTTIMVISNALSMIVDIELLSWCAISHEIGSLPQIFCP